MSFGFSVGDIVTLLHLASRTHSGWKNACGQYASFTGDLALLEAVIRRVEVEAKAPNSKFMTSPEDAEGWQAVSGKCNRVLSELQGVLDKYESVGKSRRRNWEGIKRDWDRLRMGSRSFEELHRDLTKAITGLTAYLSVIGVSSQIRLENSAFPQMIEKIDAIAEQMRKGNSTIYSTFTAYAEDDLQVWREFRRDLVKSGFQSSDIHRYSTALKTYLYRLQRQGKLDEDALAGYVTTSCHVKTNTVLQTEDESGIPQYADPDDGRRSSLKETSQSSRINEKCTPPTSNLEFNECNESRSQAAHPNGSTVALEDLSTLTEDSAFTDLEVKALASRPQDLPTVVYSYDLLDSVLGSVMEGSTSSEALATPKHQLHGSNDSIDPPQINVKAELHDHSRQDEIAEPNGQETEIVASRAPPEDTTEHLRAMLRERDEKIAMLITEVETHRADFRSTTDTLGRTPTETERVHEKRIKELTEALSMSTSQSLETEMRESVHGEDSSWAKKQSNMERSIITKPAEVAEDPQCKDSSDARPRLASHDALSLSTNLSRTENVIPRPSTPDAQESREVCGDEQEHHLNVGKEMMLNKFNLVGHSLTAAGPKSAESSVIAQVSQAVDPIVATVPNTEATVPAIQKLSLGTHPSTYRSPYLEDAEESSTRDSSDNTTSPNGTLEVDRMETCAQELSDKTDNVIRFGVPVDFGYSFPRHSEENETTIQEHESFVEGDDSRQVPCTGGEVDTQAVPDTFSSRTQPSISKELRHAEKEGSQADRGINLEKQKTPNLAQEDVEAPGPRNDLYDQNLSALTCTRCCEENISASNATELECAHIMCNDCLTQLFKLSVENPAHMPARCCSIRPILPRYAAKLFDNKFKRLWNRKYQEHTTTDPLFCPGYACGEWIPPKHQRLDTTCGRICGICRNCNIEVCESCKKQWHGSEDCDRGEYVPPQLVDGIKRWLEEVGGPQPYHNSAEPCQSCHLSENIIDTFLLDCDHVICIACLGSHIESDSIHCPRGRCKKRNPKGLKSVSPWGVVMREPLRRGDEPLRFRDDSHDRWSSAATRGGRPYEDTPFLRPSMKRTV